MGERFLDQDQPHFHVVDDEPVDPAERVAEDDEDGSDGPNGPADDSEVDREEVGR